MQTGVGNRGHEAACRIAEEAQGAGAEGSAEAVEVALKAGNAGGADVADGT